MEACHLSGFFGAVRCSAARSLFLRSDDRDNKTDGLMSKNTINCLYHMITPATIIETLNTKLYTHTATPIMV